MNRGEQAEWCPKCHAWVLPVRVKSEKPGYAWLYKWQCPIHYVETFVQPLVVPAYVWLFEHERARMRALRK